MSLQIKQLSSLGKIFKDKVYGKSQRELLALGGQEVSYQIAYRGQGEYKIKVKSKLKEYITLFDVGYVPTSMPAYMNIDDGFYEHREITPFPDPLFEKKNNKVCAKGGYNVIWVSVKVPLDMPQGKYDITIEFKGEETYTTSMTVSVAPINFKEKDFIFTEWFHTDCIANVHKVGIYSERHWKLIESYMKTATEHGITMILVPVLTPPLDTAVGGERSTTQLVDIEKTDTGYVFSFEKLHRFINLAKKCGFRYFEINHMFTQWGAEFAPKVIATVNGEKKRIFGWETDSLGEQYVEFLRALIPALIKELRALDLSEENVFFHISDEPNQKQIERYRLASKIMTPLVAPFKIIDALSHIEFYNEGLVGAAVCGIDAIEPFIEQNVPNLWGYYCCGQSWLVSNRFFAMSSARNRIIGTQIYKFGLSGFLHWGYNFYNTQYSKKQINPYQITDAGRAFPSGDAFSVYPHNGGATPSLRLKVFKEALDDMSMLYMLEEKYGREYTLKLLDAVANEHITFKSYPRNDEFFFSLRKYVVKELTKKGAPRAINVANLK